jgi:SAM-dependent methyltransferase
MVCPVCFSESSQFYLRVKDFTVSKTYFELNRCSQCDFIFTNDAPGKEAIGKYYQSDEYISHTDSSKGWMNQVYQLVRNFTIRQKFHLIKKNTRLRTGNILDYGCGTGAFLQHVQQSGWEVMGIEPDVSAQQRASNLTGKQIYTPHQLGELPNGGFDVITLWHVLEHVHDLHWTIEQFNRIVKQQGTLVIAVPNHRSWDAKHYHEYWAAYDVPRHLYHFNPSTIDTLMRRYGFTRVAIKPMWFDSIYVSLLSEKYKKGESNLLSAIFIGLISNIRAVFQSGTCSSQIYFYRKLVN